MHDSEGHSASAKRPIGDGLRGARRLRKHRVQSADAVSCRACRAKKPLLAMRARYGLGRVDVVLAGPGRPDGRYFDLERVSKNLRSVIARPAQKRGSSNRMGEFSLAFGWVTATRTTMF